MSSDPIQTALAQPESAHSGERRVLVVEDHQHTAFLLKFMLERAVYVAIIARDGRQAQKAIKRLDPVDLILLDLMMPYVSGYQIIRDVRENRAWMDVPIIVVSAKVLEKDITQALDLGANDYVTKPFRPNELLARVRRTISTALRVQEVR